NSSASKTRYSSENWRPLPSSCAGPAWERTDAAMKPTLAALVALLLAGAAAAAEVPDLPDGFANRVVAEGITGATSMVVAPDGRVFVCEQTGALRVVKEDELLPRPLLTLDVDSTWERGLLGVALDPAFAKNGYLYAFHVVAKPYPHHRLSRFTVSGDAADP